MGTIYDEILTEQFLKEEYSNKRKTLNQIAIMVGCNITLVRNRLIKFNIPIRTISEAMQGKSPWNKGTRGLMNTWNKGLKIGPQSKKHKRKLSLARTKYLSTHKGPWRDTDIERIMERILLENKILYEKQARINKKWLVDFLIRPNIIIECDGDYWHSKLENKRRDRIKDLNLRKSGYRIYRFLGSQILKEPLTCLYSIAGLGSSNQK